MYERLMHGLTRLGINKNQRDIITTLLDKGGTPLTASELAKTTGLSLSRVYSNLKVLVESGFASKTSRGTSKYFIANLPQAIKRFTKYKTEQVIKTEKELIDAVSELSLSENAFEVLKTTEEFFRAAYQAAVRAKYIKAISKTPILFFEDQRKTFWRAELYKLYVQFLKQGKPFYYIVNMPKLDKKIRISRLGLPKNHKFELRYINSKSLLGLMMTDKEVVFSVKDEEKKNIKVGIAARTEVIRKYFETIFDEAFESGEEIKN